MQTARECLEELLEEADSLPPRQRLEWLVEFGDELPAPNGDAGELQRLPECQSPVFLSVDAADPASVDAAVDVFRRELDRLVRTEPSGR